MSGAPRTGQTVRLSARNAVAGTMGSTQSGPVHRCQHNRFAAVTAAASLFHQVSNYCRQPDKVYEEARHDPLQSRERQLLAQGAALCAARRRFRCNAPIDWQEAVLQRRKKMELNSIRRMQGMNLSAAELALDVDRRLAALEAPALAAGPTACG